MGNHEDLLELRSQLEVCLAMSDRLKLGMAGIYISHALEHVEYINSLKSPPPLLRAVKGGKGDD